jgi:hypothetical protein
MHLPKIRIPKITLESIGHFEAVAIDTVSALAPWLAPIIPAFLTYTHMMGSLNYPQWVAFVGALVVEFIGLAAIYTATQFWDYNDAQQTARDNRLAGMDKKVRERAKKRRQRNAPFQWAAGAMAFYIIVILTVNAALEMETAQSGFTVKVFANGLLSLLSVIAGLIIALRSQHRRRLEQFSRRKSAQVPAQKSAEVAQTAQIARKPITEAEFLRLVGAQSYAEVADVAQAHGLNGNYDAWLSSKRSVAQLAKLVDVSPRTAQYWTSKQEKVS